MFTAQPEAPAFVLAGASGWAVNRSPQDATKSTRHLQRVTAPLTMPNQWQNFRSPRSIDICFQGHAMPELPEVETMVRGVRNDCSGRIISSVEFVRCPRKPISVSPQRKTVAQRLKGRRIESIQRLAKRILLNLDSRDSLVIEPRMTGLLLISEPPTPEHRRVVWHFEPEPNRACQMEFWDRRGLGTLALLTPDQLAELQKKLGPDALEISEEQWKQRLSKTSREIKVALLDQSLVAGIGNLYASEILHRSEISPLRSAATLTAKQIVKLNEATQHILNEAIRYEGSTLNDGTYRNALNKDGSYQNQHRVYQKAGMRCSHCGKAEIQRIVQAQRATFFCSACQK
jgi:formamidopyrimidine-DNA glycosylase